MSNSNPKILESDNKEYKINGKIHMMKYTFNEKPLCILNSIRRILLSEIPIIGLELEDNNSVIKVNNSPIHNEYLQLRVGLIPIYYSKIENCNIISEWKDNKRIYRLKNTGSHTFIIKNGNGNEDVKYSNLYKGDKKLEITNEYINKIKEKQIKEKQININLMSYVMSHNHTVTSNEIGLTVGRGIENSRFSPISYFSWEFMDKSTFENERDYELGKFGNDPKTVIMKLKSNHMRPDKLYEHSIIILKQKLYDIYKYKLDNDNLCMFDDVKSDYESVTMILKDENDTIGNLLSQMGKYYLIDDKKYLNFITYKITHPLENDIMIRCSIKNEDIFKMATDSHKEYTDNSDEERYRLYKLFVKDYIKDLIKYILHDFLKVDIGKLDNGDTGSLFNDYITNEN